MLDKPQVSKEICLVTLKPNWVPVCYLVFCHYVRADLSSRRENVIRKNSLLCLQIINLILQNIMVLAYIIGNICL